jgi:hypothetical protein
MFNWQFIDHGILNEDPSLDAQNPSKENVNLKVSQKLPFSKAVKIPRSNHS